MLVTVCPHALPALMCHVVFVVLGEKCMIKVIDVVRKGFVSLHTALAVQAPGIKEHKTQLAHCVRLCLLHSCIALDTL